MSGLLGPAREWFKFEFPKGMTIGMTTEQAERIAKALERIAAATEPAHHEPSYAVRSEIDKMYMRWFADSVERVERARRDDGHPQGE